LHAVKCKDGVQCLQLPYISADLNIINALSEILKRRVQYVFLLTLYTV